MDLLDTKPKAPHISVQQPEAGGIILIMRLGGCTPKQAAAAIKRLSALSRRVKVGKRLGATTV